MAIGSLSGSDWPYGWPLRVFDALESIVFVCDGKAHKLSVSQSHAKSSPPITKLTTASVEVVFCVA